MKCKTCGKTCEKEYCFHCKPRKRIKSYRKITNEQVDNNIKMADLFILIWNKRRHYSEISNVYLGTEPLTIYFHHILAKNKYPEAKFDEENIIILTPDEHTNVESDLYKYPEINKRREYLITKYNL